jgi:undecaprenyl-diphosphatase
MGEILIAFFLGCVEGLTEFLPISSTGHMIIVGKLLNFTDERAKTFEIFIQLGAILGVVALYWRSFFSMFLPGQKSAVLRWPVVMVAVLPVLVVGFLLRGFIKSFLFSSYTVALALIAGGVVMLFIERFSKKLYGNDLIGNADKITGRQALLIGLYQCLALWPGMSRSAATIIGGLMVGLEKREAAKFSFIIAVPVMMVAVAYELLKSWHFLQPGDLLIFSVGFITAFIVGVLSIKGFIFFLNKHSFFAFGLYRIVVGVVILIFQI